jgi:drug/metabolite transporter (DMT)-like permease
LLNEQVTPTRWAGILLISAGVGFVTQGPALTHNPARVAEPGAEKASAGEKMRAQP